jgi:DNA-binding GntR family transcriptional regulator
MRYTRGVTVNGATIGSNHRPLRDKVVDELRRRIIECDYAPGHRLTEGRLADDFGVSRNPVREAIRVLEREGFLIALPRRGAVVASISAQDIEDIFDVRLSLEVLAAQLAAQRSDAAGHATLSGLIAEAAAASTVAELARLNTAFHAEICRLSQNTLLISLLESLHDRLQWIYRQSAEVRAPDSWTEHEALAAAICAGDAEAAAHAAHTHVLAARQSALAVARRSYQAQATQSSHNDHELGPGTGQRPTT